MKEACAGADYGDKCNDYRDMGTRKQDAQRDGKDRIKEVTKKRDKFQTSYAMSNSNAPALQLEHS